MAKAKKCGAAVGKFLVKWVWCRDVLICGDERLWGPLWLWKSEANKCCERYVIWGNLFRRLACSSTPLEGLDSLVTHYSALLCFYLELVLKPYTAVWAPCILKGEIQNCTGSNILAGLAHLIFLVCLHRWLLSLTPTAGGICSQWGLSGTQCAFQGRIGEAGVTWVSELWQ